MTVTLDLANDAPIFFIDFDETIRFRANDAATPREGVLANVRREGVEDDTDAPYAGHRAPLIHVMTANTTTKGITATEVVEETSAVELAYPVGATVGWRTINRVLKANTGCVLLEIGSVVA